MALRDTLKINTTLKELNLSSNKIGGYHYYDHDHGKIWEATPEGPAALAEGLAVNTSVTEFDVRNNGLDQATKDRLFQVKNKKTTLHM